MLARKFRLPTTQRFIHAFLLHSTDFVMKYVPNESELSRFGFTVSKKVDKRAVYRNALKRRFRAQIEELCTSFPQGWDILFILRPIAKEKTTEELKQEILVALEKVKTHHG